MSIGSPRKIRETMQSFRRFARRFWPHIRRQRTPLIIATIALLAEIFLRLIEPWPLKFVFDHVLRVGSRDDQPVGETDPMTVLGLAVAAVVVIASLRAVVSYAATVGCALAGNRVLTGVRAEVLDHLQRLSLDFHSRARIGDLVNRVIGDVGRLQEVAVTAAMPLGAHVLTLIGMLAVMLWMNWQLGLLAALVLPAFLLANARIGRRIRHVSRQQRKREGDMAATVAEVLASIKLVQALGLERMLNEAFGRQNQASLREGVRAKRLAARLERGVDVLIALATAAIIWQGSRLVLQGEVTPGELVVFLAYLKNAFKPMRDLAKYAGRLSKAAASGERILDTLEELPTVQDRPGAAELAGEIHEVRFESVSLSYNRRGAGVSGVTLTAHPGETIALVGPSGAGKTTVASLLLRLYDPAAGAVLVNGRDTREYTLESLRSAISFVPQEPVLFAAGIRENIAYGRPDATDAQIEQALAIAGASEFVAQLPDGLSTVIGERGQTLSGGQRQRLALARAAVRGAPILILDEPTTGLDRRSKAAVTEALDRLAAGRISFIISHELSAVTGADRILVLDKGRIVEQGTHNELMARGGLYAAMYRLEAAERGGADTPHMEIDSAVPR